MREMNSLTLNGKKYDTFVDDKAREMIGRRNNLTSVSEIVGVAWSYHKARYQADGVTPTFLYDTANTPLTGNYDPGSEEFAGAIDCSTYVGLILRGIPFEKSPYAHLLPGTQTGDDDAADADTGSDNNNGDDNATDTDGSGSGVKFDPANLVANVADFNWAINPFEWQLPQVIGGAPKPIRTASQLAQWMYERGMSVPLDETFSNLMPGDIVYWAKKKSNGDWVQPNRYKHISHVAICCGRYDAPKDDPNWENWPEKYPYRHTTLEVTTISPYVLNRTLEVRSPGSVVMICRPDLGALAAGDFKGNLSTNFGVTDISGWYRPGLYYLTSEVVGGLPPGVESGKYCTLRVEVSRSRQGSVRTITHTLINAKTNEVTYVNTQYCYNRLPGKDNWAGWRSECPGSADYVLTEADKAEIAERAAELVEVPEGGGADLDGYATEQYVKDYAQPKGNYLTEHQDISGKLDSNKLPEAINTALAQAKASGKFDGTNGTSATHSWNGTVLTITSASGTSSADLKGAKGDKGDSVKGDPGSDGVSPTVAVSKSGKVTTVSITDKNGTKTATITDGADGTPGKTPVKGTDYWTTADQEAIVQQVISALGTPVFGRVDEDCKITLIGELADGKTYTFAFVDEDGVETVIGTYTKSNAPDYTNQIAVSTDADGNVYNGTGYKVGYRLNSSGAEDALETTATNPAFITGFIPIKTGDVVLMKDCYIDTNNVDKTSTYGKPNWSLYTNYFTSDRAHKIKTEWNNMLTSKFVKDLVLDAGGYCTGFTFTGEIGSNSIAYVQLCLAGTPETAVVTINEAIE